MVFSRDHLISIIIQCVIVVVEKFGIVDLLDLISGLCRVVCHRNLADLFQRIRTTVCGGEVQTISKVYEDRVGCVEDRATIIVCSPWDRFLHIKIQVRYLILALCGFFQSLEIIEHDIRDDAVIKVIGKVFLYRLNVYPVRIIGIEGVPDVLDLTQDVGSFRIVDLADV